MTKIYNIALHTLRAYCALVIVLGIGSSLLRDQPIGPIGYTLFAFGLFLKPDDKVSYYNGLTLILLIFIPSLLAAAIQAFDTKSYSATDIIIAYTSSLISGAALTTFTLAKRAGAFKNDHDRAVEALQRKFGSNKPMHQDAAARRR
jgi:hypothetical protein